MWINSLIKLNFIDLAKPKSVAPCLFILTACRFRENKKFWNCPLVLVFPVTAQLNHFLRFLLQKIHCLASEFHGKFHWKNRYRMNHEGISAISVFPVKFSVEFTSLALNFF